MGVIESLIPLVCICSATLELTSAFNACSTVAVQGFDPKITEEEEAAKAHYT